MRKRFVDFKVDQVLEGMESVTAEDVLAVCRKWKSDGFTLRYAIHRFERWFYITHREQYTTFICSSENINKETIWEQIPKSIPGYNGNKFIDYPHVFIPGKGSFYFYESDAENAEKDAVNKVGGYIETVVHHGMILYRKCWSNCWD